MVAGSRGHRGHSDLQSRHRGSPDTAASARQGSRLALGRQRWAQTGRRPACGDRRRKVVKRRRMADRPCPTKTHCAGAVDGLVNLGLAAGEGELLQDDAAVLLVSEARRKRLGNVDLRRGGKGHVSREACIAKRKGTSDDIVRVSFSAPTLVLSWLQALSAAATCAQVRCGVVRAMTTAFVERG